MLALKRQFHNIVVKIAWDISGIPALMTGIYCYYMQLPVGLITLGLIITFQR